MKSRDQVIEKHHIGRSVVIQRSVPAGSILVVILALGMSPYAFSADNFMPAPTVVGIDPGGTDALRIGGGLSLLGTNSHRFVVGTFGGGLNRLDIAGTFNDGSGSASQFGEVLIGSNQSLNNWRLSKLSLQANWTDIAGKLTVSDSLVAGGDPGGADKLRIGGGGRFYGGLTTVAPASVVFSNLFGDTITPGVGAVGVGPWYPGTTVVGVNGSDKVIVGYLKSVSNRATIGGHNSALNSWAPLSIAGSLVEFRIGEKLAAIVNNDRSFVIGSDPGGAGLLRVGGGADVKGTVRCKEVVVTLAGWADGVLDVAYALPKLSEVYSYIREHRHLPGIPNEQAIMRDGVNIAEMQKSQMAKIEELTLYAIDADHRLQSAQNDIVTLTAQRDAMATRVARLEAAVERLSQLTKQ